MLGYVVNLLAATQTHGGTVGRRGPGCDSEYLRQSSVNTVAVLPEVALAFELRPFRT